MRQTSWPRPFRGGTCSRLLSKYVELRSSYLLRAGYYQRIYNNRAVELPPVPRSSSREPQPRRAVCAIFGHILYPTCCTDKCTRRARSAFERPTRRGAEENEAYNEKSLVHSRDCLKDCRIIRRTERACGVYLGWISVISFMDVSRCETLFYVLFPGSRSDGLQNAARNLSIFPWLHARPRAVFFGQSNRDTRVKLRRNEFQIDEETCNER